MPVPVLLVDPSHPMTGELYLLSFATRALDYLALTMGHDPPPSPYTTRTLGEPWNGLGPGSGLTGFSGEDCGIFVVDDGTYHLRSAHFLFVPELSISSL
jgi:hypothetical protein